MSIITRCAMIAAAIASIMAPALAQEPLATVISAQQPIESAAGSGAWQHGESSPLVVSEASGSIFFGTPGHSLFNNSRGNRIPLGLNYNEGGTGVQELEITIDIPNPHLNVTNVTFGSAIASLPGWTLRYDVVPSENGSTLTISASGLETSASLEGGLHNDLFQITFDVRNVVREEPGIPFATAEMRIAEVASVLADNSGNPAGIIAAQERSVARFRIFSSVGVPITSYDGSAAVEADHRAVGMRPEGVLRVSAVDPGTKSIGLMVDGMPNPFTSSTLIRYTLASPASVRVVLSDATGRTVARLLDGEQRGAGEHNLFLDGTDLTPGIYFCTVTAGGVSSTRRLLYTP